MPDTLLKRWNSWEGGVGYPTDEGADGMHTANKLLGLRGELRPAPVATTVAVGADPGHHFQYFFEELITADQVPIFDAGSSDADATPTTQTWSHTVGTNDNRLLLVFLMYEASDTPTVTYAGEAMTWFTTVSSGTTYTSLYYLPSPTSGANNIVVAWSTATTAIGLASSWYDVDQNGPFGDAKSVSGNSNTASAAVTSKANTEVVVDGTSVTNSVTTMAKGAGQTEVDGNLASEDLRAGSSYEAGASSVTMSWALGAVADWQVLGVTLVGATASGRAYLYAQRGKKAGSSSTVKVNKVSLANADFANLETGVHDLAPLTVPGQPARYRKYWFFPMGNDNKPRRLEVVGSGAVGNDTLNATDVGYESGADHFAQLGNQLVGIVGEGTNPGGVRILKVSGGAQTDAHWGPEFQVGDTEERPAGLRALGGATFALNIEGLYSFNKAARARLIFEDFRAWRHVFDNIPIVPWKGGLVISHPTGPLFYRPGELPVNIGLNADIGGSAIAPSGPPALRGGRYHGLAPAGDFLYVVYQADLSSTTADVMVGYPRNQDPRDLIWQQLGTTTLQDSDHMLGCFVSVSSKPRSAEYVTPTLWYGNDDDLDYKVLSATGSPFRTRTDPHVVEAAGDAYLSELLFEKPTPLSSMVVYTQNMVAGDEWQLKMIADGEEETNLGPTLKRNGRHVIKIDRHDVYRLMPHVNWATTVTAARVAPSIQRIELYGPEPRSPRS